MWLEVDVTPDFLGVGTSNEPAITSDGQWTANSPAWIFTQVGSTKILRWHVASGGSIDNTLALSVGEDYVTRVANGYIKVNDVVNSKAGGTYTRTNNLILFGQSLTTDTFRAFVGKFRHFRAGITDTTKWFVPYISGGVKGILDVMSGTFIAPACGTPSISETPAS